MYNVPIFKKPVSSSFVLAYYVALPNDAPFGSFGNQPSQNLRNSLTVRPWCYSLTCVKLFVTPGTAAHQAPLSIGVSRQGYWSALPIPSPGDLPDPGIKPRSPALQVNSLPSEL